MSEINKKLSLDEATDVQPRIHQKNDFTPSSEATHEKITDLNNDTSETIDSLNSISSRIKKHHQRMEKIKNLGDSFTL